MKTAFKISDVQVTFEGTQEVAIISALLANISYDEIAAREPRLAEALSRSTYDNVMGRTLTFAGKVGLVDISTLHFRPVPVKNEAEVNGARAH